MWQPSKDGLGYWFVLEWLNVHGKIGISIYNEEDKNAFKLALELANKVDADIVLANDPDAVLIFHLCL